jgi:predicted nucleotidyltransferase
MLDEWLSALRSWATSNENVHELWLFGSRAKDISTPDSDVDLALVLVPPDGKHDWALGNFLALEVEWKRQLEIIVGRHVSLEPLISGSPEAAHVRATGKLLWTRQRGDLCSTNELAHKRL